MSRPASAGLSRRKAAWDARAVASGPETLPLFAAAPETAAAAMAAQTPLLPVPEVALPHQGEGEQVAADYRATGLTLGRHPLALLRSVLDRLGYADTRGLGSRRSGAAIGLPGLVLMRQRPGSARGVFMTVEDEHGVGNLVIYPDIAARDRAALVAGRLLIAEGQVERQVEHAEVPVTHLVVRRLVDRPDLLGCLTDPELGAGDSDWVDRVLGRADEVRRPEPGSQRSGPRLPGSRDFR
jgi:error-prone DNA polymerase